MECNKDEALRAKGIAERKFAEKDFAGAKKFALKAQQLFSGLDDISQMLTTLDVYISAENKISGERDWYGILGLSPVADDETVRKQYRKLALALHPDKNKSIGADGAFKLVSEAWSLLSDKVKRLAYNQRRHIKEFSPKVPSPSGGPSMAPRENGYHNSAAKAAANVKTQVKTNPAGPTAFSPSHKKTDTFWTICYHCKTQYEYLRIYLNHTLLCPNCQKAFSALEKAPPSHLSKASKWSSHQKPPTFNHHTASNGANNSGRPAAVPHNVGHQNSAGRSTFSQKDFQWAPFSRKGSEGGTTTSASMAQKEYEKMKRQRDGTQVAAAGLGNRNHVVTRTDAGLSNSCSDSVLKADNAWKKRRTDDEPLSGGNAARSGGYVYSSGNSKPNSCRELSLFEIRKMLVDKAQKEVRGKIAEWRTEAVERGKLQGKGGGEREKLNKGSSNGVKEHGDSAVIKKKSQSNKFSDDTDEGGIEPMSMNVPDSDFHNFDEERAESSFGDNQVWAAYDNDDGMPRYYALVQKVASLKPFRMRLSWLNSKTNSEFGPIEWVSSGFAKTCGDFRIGRYEIYKSMNCFSHKVSWTKGPRGIICIYPKKGDIWAIYRNWSPDWNQDTPDELIHKYDMVEVLDDYSEDQGVSVAPLIKVPGFKTVFRPRKGSDEIKRIKKEEMFRFSHQVPYYLLTGEEDRNAPKGCWELDPAATPLELLQVMPDEAQAPVAESGGLVEEGVGISKPTERRIISGM